MHYLITGHTGFKGSWLALMLEMQGHIVSGIALDPPVKSLFNQAELSPIFKHDLRLDIRDRVAMKQAVEMIDPEVIIHLAAQPLVRDSFRIPVETFEINVIGTLNILEATRELKNLKAVLVITTDKVYKNQNHLRGYVESDELGGEDPYSASKAAADIATQSWIKNFAKVPMAIARAGNVIGGGDWARDRLIPDLVNNYSNGHVPSLRYPNAIRPWQHVLDCLNGYLCLIESQLKNNTGGAWNFGPKAIERYSAAQVAEKFCTVMKFTGEPWTLDSLVQPKEAQALLLDSKKSFDYLNWTNRLDFEESIEWTGKWYVLSQNRSPFQITKDQIFRFFQISSR